MNDEIKLLKKMDTKIFYQAENAKVLTQQAIDGLGWLDDIQCLSFSFKEDDPDDIAYINSIIGDKYAARFIYCVNRAQLIAPPENNANGRVKLRMLANTEAQSLFIKTQAQFFVAPWSAQIDASYLKQLADFLNNDFPKSQSACVMVDGKFSGLLTLSKMEESADLVAWVWIDSELPKADRMDAHVQLLAWLKTGKAPVIASAVDSFNIRSCRFFRKLGFKTQCVQITKK